MNDLVGLGVLPGTAAIFGLFVGGPVGGFVGLLAGLVIGTTVVVTGNSQQERIDELEREVASLQRQLDDDGTDDTVDAEVGGVDDGDDGDDGTEGSAHCQGE